MRYLSAVVEEVYFIKTATGAKLTSSPQGTRPQIHFIICAAEKKSGTMTCNNYVVLFFLVKCLNQIPPDENVHSCSTSVLLLVQLCSCGRCWIITVFLFSLHSRSSHRLCLIVWTSIYFFIKPPCGISLSCDHSEWSCPRVGNTKTTELLKCLKFLFSENEWIDWFKVKLWFVCVLRVLVILQVC